MKSFVISMLFAATAAQEGYTCTVPEGDDAWRGEDFSSGDITTAEECKAFVDGAFESAPNPEELAS